MQTLNLIGPGRLGQSLALLAQASGQYRITAVLARSGQCPGALQAVAERLVTHFADLPAADFYLLAVPDGAIAEVATALAAAQVIKEPCVVFHASGALEAQILAPLQVQGALIGSLHPAFSFADPARAMATFAGTPCAIEGDALASEQLMAFAQAIGGVPFALLEGGKAAYHAALSMAANYLVTLADLSLATAAQAGIAPQMANRVVLGLMQQTLDNVRALGPAAALTGPIARGDAATVAAHLQAIAVNSQPAYRALGIATLALAGTRLTLPQQAGLLEALQP